MIPYLTTFIPAFILIMMAGHYGKIKDKRHILPQILLILACCCLSMLAALRGDTVGTDVRTYVIRYFSYAGIENNFFSFIRAFKADSVELLYMLLNWTVARFTDNVRVWYFFIEFWDMSFIIAFLWENRKKYSLPMGAFVMMMMFYNISFNAVRQMMAISVCLYSFSAARDKKLKKFIILMFIAILIHRSTVILLATYPLCRIFEKKSPASVDMTIIKYSLVSLTGLLLVNKIVYILIKIRVFPVKFSHYIGTGFSISNFSVLVFFIPVLFIIMIYRKRLYKYDSLNPVVFFYLILWPMFAQLDSVSLQFGRMAYNFMIANIVLYAQIPKLVLIEKNKSNTIILSTGTIFFWILFWIMNVCVWNVGETFPYILGV